VIAAVIADDLSGAAELAGAAAGMGFSAEVHTHFDASSGADVIAVDADSRGMASFEARRVVGEITEKVLRAAPKWIYKKTDSVLRGNVRIEIERIASVAGLSGAMLMPANPRAAYDGLRHHFGIAAELQIRELVNDDVGLHRGHYERQRRRVEYVDHDRLYAGPSSSATFASDLVVPKTS